MQYHDEIHRTFFIPESVDSDLIQQEAFRMEEESGGALRVEFFEGNAAAGPNCTLIAESRDVIESTYRRLCLFAYA